MTGPDAPQAGFDVLVADLEKTIAELAEGTAPLDQLVAAHGRALRLLAEAKARLQELEAQAEQIAKLLE